MTDHARAKLAGASVKLVGPSGASGAPATTADDGKTTLHAPAVGNYRADLTSPPPGFWIPVGSSQTVKVTGAGTRCVTFTVLKSTKKKEHDVGRRTSYGACLILVAVGLALLQRSWPSADADTPAASATWIVAGFLALLTAIGGRRGFFEPLIGTDNRTSTSRVAPALWTLSLMWALAFLLLEAGTDDTRIGKALPDARWDDYLILLGGPFAAFVIAKATTAWKVESGQLQKSESTAPRPQDVFQDDSNTTSLIDAQYLGFNVVALVYFWATIVQGIGKGDGKYWAIPQMPAQLLALTGAAALAYTGSKAVERNKPTVTAVEPASVRPGESVEISGLNFRPAGTAQVDSVSVSLEGAGVCPIQSQTNERVRVTIPRGAPAGLKNLVLTSAAKVTAEPRPIEVRADRAQLFGLREAELRPGQLVRLIGLGLVSPLAPDSRAVIVGFGEKQRVNATVTIDATGAEVVDVKVPRDLDVASASVTVRSMDGVESDPFTVPVSQRPTVLDATGSRTGEDVRLTLKVERFLAPDGTRPAAAAVKINGTTLSTYETSALGADGIDTVVVTGKVAATPAGQRASVVVQDWKGRSSEPVEVPGV